MKNKYQSLPNKWKKQADKSNSEQEQMWLYACVADLESLINQQSNKANTLDLSGASPLQAGDSCD